MKKGLGFLLIIGVLAFCNACFASEGYTVVPMPDTIVQKTPVDTAVYNNTAEFFMPYIVNELNKTQFIKSPTVSDVRVKIESDYWLNKATIKAMDDFRRFYKLDFNYTKKIAALYNTNYVLLVTSATDSANYITRRTWWDFFNIAGASVLDPAYKINLYAVLIDTDKDLIVWNQTYQKTISVVENRIVPVGYAPQTEQLQKIKDYSVYLAPRVAQSVQNVLLSEAQKAVEANLIHTDYGSIDNVFTKKYRSLRKEIKDAAVVPAAKTREGYGIAKEKYNELKEDYQAYKIKKQQESLQKETSKDVKILPINFLKKKEETPTVIIEPTSKAVENVVQEPIKEIKNVDNINDEKKNVINVSESSQSIKENVLINKEEEKVLLQSGNAEKQNNLKMAPLPSQNLENTAAKSPDNSRMKPVKIKEVSIEDDKDLPVDSLIYTHPTNYKINEYLPVKPRLREIKTDDTYNAF